MTSLFTAGSPSRPLAAHRGDRPASVFPGAGAGTSELPRLLWAGGSDAMRRWTADHVEAVGAVLEDPRTGSDGARAVIGTLPALARRSPRGGGGRLPLVALSCSERVSEDDWSLALELGVRAVVRMPDQSDHLLELLGDVVRTPAGALVLGVAGACGGAGASSLAARLAGAAARGGGKPVLVDADPLGGGLDTLVEAEHVRGACWEDLGEIGEQDGPALRDGLPEIDGVRMLVARGAGLPSPARTAAALAALAPLGGTVVVDLAADQVEVVLPRLDRLILLIPSTDHALRAATRRIAHWRPPTARTGVVIRGLGPVTPADAAQELGLPVLGRFPDCRHGTVPLLDVRRGGADGLCARLLRELRRDASCDRSVR